MSEILVYGEIGDPFGGTTAQDFARQLKAAQGEPITIRIASPGGDLFQGLAMYDYLRSVPDTTAVIDGAAASIATIIALGARRVVMPANATLMVHAPSTVKEGRAEDMRAAATLLEKTQAKLVAIISEETGATTEQVSVWLSTETWFNAEEAKAAGFVDEISQAAVIRNHFDLSQFANVPARVRDAFTQAQKESQTMKTLLKALVNARLLDCACMTAQAPDEKELEKELTNSLEALTAERDELKAKLEAVEAELAGMKDKGEVALKARAEAAVDLAVTDGRLPSTLRQTMLAAYLADETTAVKNLRELKPSSKGTDPIPRGGAPDNKSLKERIDAEPDYKKRLALRLANYDALAVS